MFQNLSFKSELHSSWLVPVVSLLCASPVDHLHHLPVTFFHHLTFLHSHTTPVHTSLWPSCILPLTVQVQAFRLNVEMKSGSSCLPCPVYFTEQDSHFYLTPFYLANIEGVNCGVRRTVIDKAWMGWQVGTDTHACLHTQRHTTTLQWESAFLNTSSYDSSRSFLKTNQTNKLSY